MATNETTSEERGKTSKTEAGLSKVVPADPKVTEESSSDTNKTAE